MGVRSRQSIALFDESHGQPNWAQTGFPSRLMATNMAGVAGMLRRHGFQCEVQTHRALEPRFPEVRLVVIAPPAGEYDAERELWRPSTTTLFLPDEICALRRFVDSGGRLLVFGYRFGDSFTRCNLGEVCAAFGCLLNDDGIIDLRRIRWLYPLSGDFATNADSILTPWAAEGVQQLRWRCMASFTILPGVSAFPVVMSPGGHCLAYNLRHRQLNFQSQPIAVAGTHGHGRFAFFGGPHAFETSPHGLFHEVDNQRLLENVLRWLDGDDDDRASNLQGNDQAIAAWRWRKLCRIDGLGDSAQSLRSVEEVLHKSQTLRALPRWKWRG